jgi:outer membrane receptor protein involved in Fe transport
MAIFVCVGSLCAQETINNASLAGRVTDPTGAVIRNATVTARAVSTDLNTAAVTDAAGRFRFPYLQVGQYEVTIHDAGFSDNKRTLTLTIGAAFDLPVTLNPGTAQAVTVNDVAPVLEADRSQVAGTISQNEVADLPFNGRNFLDLALLVPGVSPTNTAANQLFAETSAVPGQGLSVGSQHNFSNSFIVDGLSANDDAAGLVQTDFGLDVVQEMQVVTNGGQAEYGRALAGYFNYVSKSGGNKLHGDVYSYLRDKNLNAKNAYSGRLLPYTQSQSGISVGGPLRKDRTFFFGNFEYRQLNQANFLTITSANAAAIDTVLTADNYPGQLLNISPSNITVYPNPVRYDNFFFKVDHKLNEKDQLTARYSLYHVSSINSRNAGGLTYTSGGANLNDLDQTVAVSNIYTINSHTVNETRGQFTNSNLLAPVVDTTGPAVSISNAATFGTASGSPTGRYDRLYEVVDNLSRQIGPHSVRVGADFLYNDLTITFPMSNRGSYSFSSLANFQKGIYSTYAQTFGNFVVPQTNPNFGMYAQDEWKVSPRLTLNAGVRYDLQWLKAINTDTKNVSPRIGFAYSPFQGRGTVIRGSFGLFYDRVPLRALSNALESDGNGTAITANTLASLSLSYGQTNAPVFPNIVTGYTALTLPPTLRLSLSTMDPNMKNARAIQNSLEIDQQISSTSNLTVAYQHIRGEDILIDVNLNVPTCYASQPASGPLYPVVDPIDLCRPNQTIGNNKQYYPGADSYFDALTVSYNLRPVHYGSFRLSYTWSKAIDDVSYAFFSGPANNYDPGEDRSISDDNQKHRVVVDGTLHTSMEHAETLVGKLTHGFQLGGTLTYYSGFPFNITTGQNSIQTTGLRPCLPGFVLTPNAANTCANALPGTMISRNSGLGFPSFTINTRLSRTFDLGERFKLQGLAEAFNLINTRNDLFPNGTFGTGTYPTNPSSTFGQPTNSADPRSIEFAAKLIF